MFHRIFQFCILFIVFETTSWAAVPPFLSLHRISLNVTGTYHRNSWDLYNEVALQKIHQIGLDIIYFEPRGRFEKIRGDAGSEIQVNYRIFKQFFISFRGEGTWTASTFNFYPDPEKLKANPRVPFSPADYLNLKFSYRGYGIGAGTSFRLHPRVRFSISADVKQYSAQTKARYLSNWEATGPLTTGNSTFQFEGVFKSENQWGKNLQIALNIGIFRSLSLIIGGRYRWLKFPEFKGSGRVVLPFGEVDPAHVQLIRSPKFFGIYSEDPLPMGDYYVHTFEFLNTGESQNWQPFGVDLNSFGGFMGLKWEF